MKLIDAKALADLLGMDQDYVRDRVSKGRGFPSAMRIGAALRWRQDEIEDWLETRRVSPASRRAKSRSPGSRSSGSTGRGAPTSAPAPAETESSTAA